MKYTINYPNGGSNKMWEPIDITATLKALKGLSIQGRTWTRDGCQLTLLDVDNQVMGKYTYSYHSNGPAYYTKMANDVAVDINLMLELAGKKVRILSSQLVPVMKEVFEKCESRYGNQLPNADYEAKVVFE